MIIQLIILMLGLQLETIVIEETLKFKKKLISYFLMA